VEGFSIGFGPKIVSWPRNGIEYAWRWIPAGGFVKLPQMVTSEALEGKESGEPVPPASPWSKILVAFAGPAMNCVLAFVIATVIYFVGLPIPVNPAIVGHVDPGSPEAAAGLKPGDRIVAVNGKPVKSWEDAQMTTALAPTNIIAVTFEDAGAKRTAYLHAKYNSELGLKLLDLDPSDHPVIREVLSGSAAEGAGLKKGDEVLSFDGVPVVGQEQLVDLIKKRPDKPSQITVKRGQKQLQISVTPKFNPATHGGFLGVSISPNTTTVYEVQWPGPAPWKLVGEVFGQTFGTIAALVHSKQTGVGVKDLSGPVGILPMLAVELKADFRLALKFMVLLNISLAILNLLPLPVLDGGHIAMSIIEGIRGRPLSPRIQEYATTVFAVLLISFVVYVSYNDVVHRLPLFRTLFNQKVQIESGPTNKQSVAPGR
jgi:regulator of sigma E protease